MSAWPRQDAQRTAVMPQMRGALGLWFRDLWLAGSTRSEYRLLLPRTTQKKDPIFFSMDHCIPQVFSFQKRIFELKKLEPKRAIWVEMPNQSATLKSAFAVNSARTISVWPSEAAYFRAVPLNLSVLLVSALAYLGSITKHTTKLEQASGNLGTPRTLNPKPLNPGPKPQRNPRS